MSGGTGGRARYSRVLLERTARESRSAVDMLGRLGAPVDSGPLRYLRSRLKHYGIDVSHFVEEALPARPHRSYPREALEEAARRSTCIREVLEHLGVCPEMGPYSHVSARMRRLGIDTSHFTRGRGRRPDGPTREQLVEAVAASRSLAGVLRLLGLPEDGARRAYLKRSLAEHGIPYEHFTGQGHRRGRRSPQRKSAAEILCRLEPGAPRARTTMLRRALTESGVPGVCAECGIGETWRGRRLVLEVDHVNGDRLDNRLENLRFLCPSCHSQTPTFGNRSRHPANLRRPVEWGRRGPVSQLAKRTPV
jgi:hypothetical protein